MAPIRSSSNSACSASLGLARGSSSHDRSGAFTVARPVSMERPARVHQVVGYASSCKTRVQNHVVKGAGRLLGKVGKASELRVCYETGPTGMRCTGN
jgi:hypothetical protein